MPSNSKLFVKPFIGGINTETSSVEEAMLYTTDELNCTILPEGIRGRRLGFNIERNGKWIESVAKDATSLYYWDNVGKRNFDYIVVQRDNVLHFFINSETEISTQKSEKTIDLTKHIVKSTRDKKIRYASVSGSLLVVGEWIDPLKISWDFDNNKFIVEKVNIKWRDLIGIDDGLELDTMPAELSPEHQYNLYNQGWDKFVYDKNNVRDNAIDKFKDTIGLYPSNNMLHYLDKRGDTSSDYDAFEIMKHFYGNTPAPKGHYILDYFSRSRATVSGIVTEGESQTSQRDLMDWSSSEYWRNVLSGNTDSFTMMIVGAGFNLVKDALKPSLTNDVILNATGSISNFSFAIRDFCKKNGDPYVASHRDMNRTFEYKKGVPWYTGPISVTLFGVDAEGKETSIFTEQYVADSNSQVGTIFASDTVNLGEGVSYDKYFVRVTLLGLQPDDYVLIQPIWSIVCSTIATESVVPAEDFITGRIKDVVCFSGRYFYLVDDVILFSQVLTETGQGFDKCYQEADPTSEEINEVVDTDGGYVKFPSMGYGKALKTFNRGVLVFGDSSVYGLISPAEHIFTATSYDIVELSRAGLVGEESIVSTSDKVFYWSPLGIFQIGVNEQTGNTVVAQSISINTIQELYNNIPMFSKENCKGVYDYVNNRIYWYYPTDERYKEKLSGCLVLDLTHNSFMQFKIGDPSSDLPSIASAYSTPNAFEIKPTMYVRVNGDKVVTNNVSVIAVEEKEDNFKRWTAIKHLIEDGNGSFSFGDYNSREYKDFDKYIYDSYMVSRPIMFAGFSTFGNMISDTYSDKQVPVLQTLFKRTEQSPLVPVVKPVEHTYKLKDDVSYITEAGYDITSGTLSKHSVAKALIFNDKGLFRSCRLRVDVRDFKGKNIDIAAEIIGDNKSLQNVIMYNKHVDSDYINIDLKESLEDAHNNYVIRVVAEIRSGEVSKEKIHFTADFVQDRVSPSLPVFAGFEEVVVENTERMVKVNYPTRMYQLDIKLPTMYTTSFQVEAMPILNVDKEWSIGWDCSTDTGNNLFSGYRSLVGYGVSYKSSPTETAYADSVMDTNNISKHLTIGTESININKNEWVSMKVRYKLTGLIPIYKEAAPVKKDINYVAASGANIRMRWGWSLDSRSNRWDMVQNGYKPQKDFLHDEYVESRIHVRGRGKAFQVEIRNDSNKDFRLAGMNLVVRSK